MDIKGRIEEFSPNVLTPASAEVQAEEEVGQAVADALRSAGRTKASLEGLKQSLSPKIPQTLKSEVGKTKELFERYFGSRLTSLASSVGRAVSSAIGSASDKISGKASSKRLAQAGEPAVKQREQKTAKSTAEFPKDVRTAEEVISRFFRSPPSRAKLEAYFSKALKNESADKTQKSSDTAAGQSVGSSKQGIEGVNKKEAEICYAVVKEARNGTIPDDVENYSKTEDNGVATLTFTKGGQKYEVNYGDSSNSYNGVKRKDLLDRANLFFDAAIAADPDNEEAKKEIEAVKQDVSNQLMALGRFSDPDRIDADLDKAKIGLGAAFLKTETIVQKSQPNFNLQKAESEFVLKRGRPIIVNFFRVTAGDESREVVGIQRPMGEKTIPSSIKTMSGLANYVSSSGGVVENGEVKLNFTGMRHSRPSPIEVKDGYKRRAIAASNTKQSIVDVAKGMEINQGNSKSNPLVVPLAPTTLLTAKRMDFIRNKKKVIAGKWTGESETMQLKEVMQAYRSFDGCPMKVEIGGEERWIKPEIHHMNFGVNPPAAGDGLLGKLPSDPAEDKLNAHGMMSQQQLVKDYFRGNEKVVNFLSGNTSELESQYEVLKGKIHDGIKKDQTALQKAYDQYLEQPSSDAGKEVKRLEKKIARRYNTLDFLARGIVKEQKKSFLERFESGDFEKDLSELKKTLEPKQRSILQDFADFKRAVFTGAHKNTATVVSVPATVIDMNSKMGVMSFYYCKSAEDRTGNVEIFVGSRETYEEMKGEGNTAGIIDCSEENSEKNEIIKQMHTASPSLNNTGQNSNARGLQISDKVNPKGMEKDIKNGKKMAALANGVPKEAKRQAAEAA